MQTSGYTEIVKMTEAFLKADQAKAIVYMNNYIMANPNTDLAAAFTSLIQGNINPSGVKTQKSGKQKHDKILR